MGELMGFTNQQLQQLADTAEIRVETEEAGKRHTTTIWVVVDDGAAFIRSAMGARGRWYQRVLREGKAVIRAGHTAIAVRAEPERDVERNRLVDEAYRRKYGRRWPEETEGILARDVAQTTLRVVPA